MRRTRIRFALVAAVLAMALPLAACGDDSPGGGGGEVASETSVNTSKTPVKQAVETDFDRNKFSKSTTIDNRWAPLKPGTQFVTEGAATVDGERIRRRVVFTVTDLTKVVDGVRSVVIWDRDYNNDVLVEAELAYFAQDDDGNVWQMGQYPEEYEEGKLVGHPAWIAGLEGAKPGILMRADPRLGTSDYSQGWAPEVEYADRAKVLKMGQKTCVTTGCYEDVLLTQEWDEADPAAQQLKYYAPDVGNVRIGWSGKDEEKETMVLTRLGHLDAGELAQAREAAVKLEQSAYRVLKDLFGKTEPAVHTP
jgi:hypothetical protein